MSLYNTYKEPPTMSELSTDRLSHTHISLRTFICRGPSSHRFSALVRSSTELRMGETIPRTASFQPIGTSVWLPAPICQSPHCGFLSVQQELYDPKAAAIPEQDRFVAWLSPDGTKIRVPGRNDASMAPRYVRAGYTRVVGSSLQDLDRFDSIRAAETGNDVSNEMNYSEPERLHRREYSPDHDAENVAKIEI